jgi:membrane-associated phospholipid phosphatase
VDRIGKSASDAALQPETWAPLATGILLAVTGADTKIQQWAYENTPVFGSVTNARNYSDYFQNASACIYLTSVMITPSRDEAPSWLLNKTKGLTVGFAAILSTQIVTSGLKSFSGRERPDGSDNESFPSGHTSAVAANTMLTSRNIEYLRMNPYVEGCLKVALNTMTLATGWARVEGNRHYPTDILFGTALGNFIGTFINDSFLGRYSNNIKFSTSLSVKIRPNPCHLPTGIPPRCRDRSGRGVCHFFARPFQTGGYAAI